MPKELLKIKSFAGIAITDEQRMEIGKAYWAENVDPVGSAGMLTGLRNHELVDSKVQGIRSHVTLPTNEILAIADSVTIGGTTHTDALISFTPGTTPTLIGNGYGAFKGATMATDGRVVRMANKNIAGDLPRYYDAGLGVTGDNYLERPPQPSVSAVQSLRRIRANVTSVTATFIDKSDLEGGHKYSISLVISVPGDYSYLFEDSGFLDILFVPLKGGTIEKNLLTQILTVTLGPDGYNGWDTMLVGESGIYGGRPDGVALGASVTESGGTIYFNKDGDVVELATPFRVFYAIAYEYDGFQEGPLSEPVFYNGIQEEGVFTLDFDTITGFSARVTAVQVYRALTANAVATVPDTEFRHIATLPVSGGAASGRVIDDLSEARPTYYERTGVPETVDTQKLAYSINAVVGPYHYIANVAIVMPDGSREYYQQHVFRSKAFRHDMFDWTTDFVTLREPVTHIMGYMSNVLIFSNESMYIANQDLAILDKFPGAGIPHKDAICAFRDGIAFANENGIFVWDGANLTDLSGALKEIEGSPGQGWYGVDGSNIRVCYVPQAQMLLFYYNTLGQGFALHVDTKTITFIDDTAIPDSVLYSDNGTAYATFGASGLQRLLSATSRRAWKWESNDLAIGERFRLYDVYTSSSGLFVKARVDGNLDVQLTEDGVEFGRYPYRAPSTYVEGRNLRIRIEGGANTKVTDVAINIRRLRR